MGDFIFLKQSFFWRKRLKLHRLTADLKGDKFYNNHCAVNNNSTIDGAHTHQVYVDVEDIHHRQGKQQGKRNNRSYHQAWTEISQQKNNYKNYNQKDRKSVV